jgi:phage tail P2-like protein
VPGHGSEDRGPCRLIALLPPNATALETGLARLGARLSDIAIPIADLWNPQTCPLAALPWLAWTLSIDKWDTDWTEERKRAATAGAIAAQRRKGSVASVRAVLRGIDDLLELVEGDPVRAPHRFTVRMPVADEDGTLGGPACRRKSPRRSWPMSCGWRRCARSSIW